jgi:hypothetical protein
MASDPKMGVFDAAKAKVATPPPRLGLFDAARSKLRDRSLLMPVSQLMEELTAYEKQIVDPKTGYALILEQITVDTAIELKVIVNSDGTVELKSAPPTQLFQTTIMPVFHHMRLRVVREDGE